MCGPGLSRDSWTGRAALAFFVGYVVIGMFGSRHNVPLVYALAALPVSARMMATPNRLQEGQGS